MQRRTLKGTDLEVSRACLGTMTFGGQASEEESRRILDCALDAGMNFIDTANVYAGGESERLLGKLLQGRRDVLLASKIGMKVGDEPPGLSHCALIAAVENSLRRLRTDTLDICYLHTPDPATPLEESLAAMDTLVSSGKVRYPGTSNYASWQVGQALSIAARYGYTPARLAQPMYNLLARRIEDELLPACAAFDVSVIVYNPLAGGLLTGKHNDSGPLAGTRFYGNQAYLDRYWNDASRCAVTRLASLAQTEGRSLISMSLGWLLHHTSVDCVVLGASRAGQLEANLRAFDDGPLSPAALGDCDEIYAPLRGVAPKYNR